MNDYFAALGLARAFDIPSDAVEEAYFAAQRRWHPDRFVGKAPAERMEAAQASVMANEAYRALNEPFARAQHLLALRGIDVATDHDTILPSPELLLEMLERREHLAESTDAEILSVLEIQAQSDINRCIAEIGEAFSEDNLQAAAHQTLRLKYLRALEQEIAHHPAWTLSPPDLPSDPYDQS